MEKQAEKLELSGTVDTCPVCGYTDGFHVSFEVNNGSKNIKLICPQCHSRFNPNWTL